VTVRFESVTLVGAPAERVFDLSLNVDSHLRSMTRSRERAVAGVTSGAMSLGDEVTWSARHFGVPWRMRSRIVELDRPGWFVDEQVRGPFARFRHEHRFEQTDSGTRMTDTLRFDAPLGPLGRLVERVVLDGYVRRLIRQRADSIRAEAEQDP
jgi:ligand-binding SRPBCC domain-containing protein